jgi:hypothetical protein
MQEIRHISVTDLGRVDKLISETLGDRLDVSESGLSGTSAQQPDGLHENKYQLVYLPLRKQINGIPD